MYNVVLWARFAMDHSLAWLQQLISLQNMSVVVKVSYQQTFKLKLRPYLPNCEVILSLLLRNQRLRINPIYDPFEFTLLDLWLYHLVTPAPCYLILWLLNVHFQKAVKAEISITLPVLLHALNCGLTDSKLVSYSCDCFMLPSPALLIPHEAESHQYYFEVCSSK